MCGIIGYIGKRPALPILLEGLKHLEYRGYDSAGVCVLNQKGGVFCVRSPGRIAKLEERLQKNKRLPGNATCGIGHSRWATHGQPSETNAHPHADCTKSVYVVHNGIIENYRALREMLEKEGHVFTSQTDTEVIPHLIERNAGKLALEDAVSQAIQYIEGTFGIAVVSAREPEKIVVARRSSPLILGIGHGEHFVASDVSALIAHTRSVVYLNDDEVAVLTRDGYAVRTLESHRLERVPETIEWSRVEAEKGGFAHFMAKEIYEAPLAVENALRGRILETGDSVKLGGLEDITEELVAARRMVIVACGTSHYAGLVGALMLEEHAGVAAEAVHASEFRYRAMPLERDAVVVAISQSGETADVLAALREAKRRGAFTLGIVNVVGSSVARETDAGIYNHAGPEIGVASTKSFISQLAVLALFAAYLGQTRHIPVSKRCELLSGLRDLPKKLRSILAQSSHIEEIAKRYAKFDNFLYIGRRYQYPAALEGALKLKEISYIHAEGYAAGEMKHGPIALISENFPTIALAPSDSMYGKMVSNIQEIKARGGLVIMLATEGNKEAEDISSDVIYIPEAPEMLAPILSVVPLQLLAYHIAVVRGCDVDKPRNLAKSVTVE